jgi:Uma2 family endonuclease
VPSRRSVHLEDIDALPPDLIGEIIDGALYTRSRPSPAHQFAAGDVHIDLGLAFGRGRGGPGGWWILPDPALALPDSPHVVPDVAGWRRDRMPAMPGGPISVVPDWVCEVLSPTTRRDDVLIKIPKYARAGVLHAWLVDIETRVVTAHRLQAGLWLAIGTFSAETEARIEPFDIVPLNVAQWWIPNDATEGERDER